MLVRDPSAADLCPQSAQGYGELLDLTDPGPTPGPRCCKSARCASQAWCATLPLSAVCSFSSPRLSGSVRGLSVRVDGCAAPPLIGKGCRRAGRTRAAACLFQFNLRMVAEWFASQSDGKLCCCCPCCAGAGANARQTPWAGLLNAGGRGRRGAWGPVEPPRVVITFWQGWHLLLITLPVRRPGGDSVRRTQRHADAAHTHTHQCPSGPQHCDGISSAVIRLRFKWCGS